jgi:hypothetical protein
MAGGCKAAMEAAAGGHRAALNKSCRIYGDDDDTLFRLIAIGNAKVWVRFAQPFSSKWVMSKQQMDDAKARVTWVN